MRAPWSTPTPKSTPNTDHGVSFPPQKLWPWSEFLLALFNTESGAVWVFSSKFFSDHRLSFLQGGQKHWGRGRRMSIDLQNSKLGVRQRRGEGVVRRNGCPKGCFWRVHFFSASLRFALKHLKALRGQRRNGLSKNTLLHNRFSARRLLRYSENL